MRELDFRRRVPPSPFGPRDCDDTVLPCRRSLDIGVEVEVDRVPVGGVLLPDAGPRQDPGRVRDEPDAAVDSRRSKGGPPVPSEVRGGLADEVVGRDRLELEVRDGVRVGRVALEGLEDRGLDAERERVGARLEEPLDGEAVLAVFFFFSLCLFFLERKSAQEKERGDGGVSGKKDREQRERKKRKSKRVLRRQERGKKRRRRRRRMRKDAAS